MPEQVVDEGFGLSKLLPAVRLTRLPSSLLKFPPASEPKVLPPPPNNPNFAHPFSIPVDWYNALLEPVVPITIAIIYAITVTIINSVNAQRKWKPWAFSKSSVFKLFVILHNVILAVYSAWTFLGMLNALKLALPNWHEHGAPGVVDALCKIQGPRGLGSAATFNERSVTWGFTDRTFHLSPNGTPESSDVGRIWNEGLAFYGWLFYLSKFYEVIDTAIILAKGKKSSFLQTYHHAGAMMCMWAGIRYMSPPIWMFVFVNSFIHALMYSFYLCSALKIHVPKRLKRALTTMQIAQFIVGAIYAFLHLFVKYQVPVTVPYLYHVAPKIASIAASDASKIATAVVASATGDTRAFLKKIALRAAGYEGLAENVDVRPASSSGQAVTSIPQQLLHQAETRDRAELQWVHCLDTSGQAFAILLNCLYLAPLTWLFARFFVKAYLTQLERRRSSTSSDRVNISKTFDDATKGVGRRLSEALLEMHNTGDSSETDSPIVESEESINTLKRKAANAAEKTVDSANQKAEQATTTVKDASKDISEKIGNIKQEAVKKSTPIVDDLSKKARQKADELEKRTKEAQESAKKSASEVKTEVESSTEPASKVTQDKSFADAVKEESDSDAQAEVTTSKKSPNDNGTGAAEGSGSQTNSSEAREDSAAETAAKKEEDKIIEQSKPVREDEVTVDSGADGTTQTNGGGNGQTSSSNIPRPKKLKKKA